MAIRYSQVSILKAEDTAAIMGAKIAPIKHAINVVRQS
jgi:hypothetical protein